jgi:hypothetical protein
MKQFCMRVPREDVRENFSFQYFKIQNMYNMNFKIVRAYAPMFQNTTPCIMMTLLFLNVVKFLLHLYIICVHRVMIFSAIPLSLGPNHHGDRL